MHLEEVREAKRCTGIKSYEITTEALLKHWDNAAWWAWSRLFQGQFFTTSDGRLEPDASVSEARAANVKHGPGGGAVPIAQVDHGRAAGSRRQGLDTPTLRTLIIVLPPLTFRTQQILPHTNSYFHCLHSYLDLLQ